MNTRLLFFLCGLISLSSKAQLTSTNLPIVIINATSAIGSSQVQADFAIINNTSGLNTPTSTPAYSGIIGINLRGNTATLGYPKKCYSVETWSSPGTSLDTTLLDLSKENDWVLLAAYPDRSLLRTPLSFHLHRKMGHYAPHMRFCELILNNQYQGIYLLGEKIKRDTNRVNIAKLTTSDNSGVNLTGGYIWKVDDETGAGWTSSYAPPFATTQTYKFNYEYPSSGSITGVQGAYSKAYVDSFENALNSSTFTDTLTGWRQFAGLGSMVDFMIMQEVSHNNEAYRVNTFIYKDKSKKLHMGPLWNGELSYANTASCNCGLDTGWCYNLGSVCGSEAKLPPFWWSKLVTDQAFMDTLKCTYHQYRQPGNILDTVTIFHFIDSVSTYLNAQNAVSRNFTQWPIWGVPIVNEPTPMPTSYSQEVLSIKTAIKKRLLWLDGKWNSTNCATLSSVLNQSNPVHWEVYPNPAHTELFIKNLTTDISNCHIRLLSMTGNTLIELDSKLSLNRLDIQHVSQGLYWLELRTASQTSVQKILID